MDILSREIAILFSIRITSKMMNVKDEIHFHVVAIRFFTYARGNYHPVNYGQNDPVEIINVKKAE
jgi:hypothetical protein